eukprot:7611563-Ditylum_brightwellii.AAC.1
MLSIVKGEMAEDQTTALLARDAHTSMGNIQYKNGLYVDAAAYYEIAIRLQGTIISQNKRGDAEDPSCMEAL